MSGAQAVHGTGPFTPASFGHQDKDGACGDVPGRSARYATVVGVVIQSAPSSGTSGAAHPGLIGTLRTKSVDPHRALDGVCGDIDEQRGSVESRPVA